MSSLAQLQSDVATLQGNYAALSTLLKKVGTDIQNAITILNAGNNEAAIATLDAAVQAINTQVVADTGTTQAGDTALEGAEAPPAAAVPAATPKA